MDVATINEASPTTERPEYMAVLCAAADGHALIKKRKIVRQRLLIRPSGIPVFTVIFTVKFLYLQIPSLLPLPSNSITCIFHPCYCYCHIPLISNSTFFSKLYFTFKFKYLQIPRQLIYSQIPALASSITCKFI